MRWTRESRLMHSERKSVVWVGLACLLLLLSWLVVVVVVEKLCGVKGGRTVVSCK